MRIFNDIGGRSCPPMHGGFLKNMNPATGECYSEVPDSTREDVNYAVDEARKAFPLWSALSREERSFYLHQIGELIEKNKEELAKAESIDNGKPLSLARKVDIPRSAANFHFFADLILKFDSFVFPEKTHGVNIVEYSPLGVVGCISPWNLPLYLLSWKIAPALAAGNTVVAKPSEVTPMTASLLGRLAREAGLPPGVLNIVHGTGRQAGAVLCENPHIKGISFTGSTATGREISRMCASRFVKLSLEMGGKNPNIIFSDCDFEKAVEGTLKAAFSNQGQICLCGSRIFVERPLYNRFKEELIKRTNALKVGDPLDEQTDQGAIVSEVHFQKIMKAIEQAKKEGGVILTGGESMCPSGKNGFFIKPTLIEGLDSDSFINQEEIFGPVATLNPFDTEEEVVSLANCTSYGLSGSIWSKDLNKARRVARNIDSGILWINTWMLRDLRTPFGGMKNSGMGREGGDYALGFFSNIKNICMESS